MIVTGEDTRRIMCPPLPSASGERKPIPFLVTQADETFGQF
jgi:hypothetical protein